MTSAPTSGYIKGMALLFGAAVLWSFGGLLIKWISWHPMAIAGGRSAFALVIDRH